MACLLVLVVAATLLTAPPGKLTHAARTTSPGEEFWRTALPGAPMPESLRELILRPAVALGTRTTNAPKDNDDPPVPPMNFKYDDYRSSRRRHEAAAAAPSRDVLLNKRVDASARRSAAASSPALFFFLEEALRVGEALPFRTVPTDDVDDAPAARPPVQLYTVRAVRAVDGCRFVVCRRREAAGPRGAVYGCRATGPAARAYVADVAASESGETVAAAVVCHADTSPWGPARAAFRLLDVKPGDAAVCHAVLGAEVLPVKEDERRPSSA